MQLRTGTKKNEKKLILTKISLSPEDPLQTRRKRRTVAAFDDAASFDVMFLLKHRQAATKSEETMKWGFLRGLFV